MKTLTTLALSSLGALTLVAGCQQNPVVESTPEVKEVSFNVAGSPTVAFHVPDMKCQYSCVDAVKKTLSGQAGVKEVKVDFDTRQATLVVDSAAFDPETAVEALVDHQFFNTKLVVAGKQVVVSKKVNEQ